jgi:MFS family permease
VPAHACPAAPEANAHSVSVVLVTALAALSATNYFDRSILAIAAPTLIREFGISETAMGTAFSAFLLSYTALLTPGGWVADRAGPRRVLALACAAWTVFTAATALAGLAPVPALTPLAALIVIRFVLGASSAPLYPACSKIVAAVIAPERATAIQGLVVSASAIGSAAAPFIFSRLIEAFGWRLAFCFAALLTGVMAGIWPTGSRAVPDRGRSVADEPQGSAWRTLSHNRTLLWLSASYFCLNYFEYIFFYWMYYYFGEIRHFPPSLATAASTATMLGMVIMGPGGGWMADRLAARRGLGRGRRWVAAAGMALSSALLYLGAAGFGPYTTIALLAFSFGCASAAEGPFWATAAAAGKDYAGAAGGFMNMVGNTGGMLAPVLTPMIASRFGWHSALWAGSAMVLLGVVAWAGVRDSAA